jgi:epoxyqueuosine reductase
VSVDSAPVLERSWSQDAGLGFVGKNTCLIHPRQGSWLFLATLLVPEELDYDEPPRVTTGMAPMAPIALQEAGPPGDDSTGDEAARDPRGPSWRFAAGETGGCGGCTRCLAGCPTRAFPAPFVLDARRCISYLTIELRGSIPPELRPAMGNWVFGCDVCQDVCPWNGRQAQFDGQQAAIWFQPDANRAAVPLLDLLALDDATFRSRFRGSPVKRAGRARLVRNACVAAGNWADPQAVPALLHCLHDAAPLVRAHAAWALGRIDSQAARAGLRTAWSTETDEAVLAEVKLALAA